MFVRRSPVFFGNKTNGKMFRMQLLHLTTYSPDCMHGASISISRIYCCARIANQVDYS